MTEFGIQVLVHNSTTNVDEWRWMRPTGGPRYTFKTQEEAESTRRMCYPEQPRSQVRVVSLADYPA